MDADEIAAFERRPDRDDLVALRRADDAAKVRGKDVDPLDVVAPRRHRACVERGAHDAPIRRRSPG